MGNPSQYYRVSLAILDHTILLTTLHKWTPLPARLVGYSVTYPGGMEGWVDQGELIVPLLAFEPATTWLKVWCHNRCATKTPISRQHPKHYLYSEKRVESACMMHHLWICRRVMQHKWPHWFNYWFKLICLWKIQPGDMCAVVHRCRWS